MALKSIAAVRQAIVRCFDRARGIDNPFRAMTTFYECLSSQPPPINTLATGMFEQVASQTAVAGNITLGQLWKDVKDEIERKTVLRPERRLEYY